MPTPAPAKIVFTEIPAADTDRAVRFYEALFGAALTRIDDGPNPIWMFPAAEGSAPIGHLYPGEPATDGAGMTAHFAVLDTLDGAMARVRDGGGTVVSDVIEIYSGAFFYAKDSEGNSIGLFKYKV